MKPTFQYLPIKGINNAPTVNIADLDSFIDLVTDLQAKYIFTKIESSSKSEDNGGSLSEDIFNRTRQLANSLGVTNENTQSEFSFIHDGINYNVNALGFQTIESYQEAKGLGFSSGDDFAKAQELSFEDAEKFNEYTQTGFEQKEDFEKAKQLGFVGAFQKLNAAGLKEEARSNIKSFKKDADIYEMATRKNYENFDQFFEAVIFGFAKHDAADFKLAIDNGFDSANLYYKARNRGFETAQEFKEAEALHLDDKFELSLFKNINQIKDQHNYPFHDQAHIFNILKELEPGSETELKKIEDIFKSEQDKLKYQTNVSSNKGTEWISNSINKLLKSNTLPNWYKVGFNTKEEIKTFLISNQAILQLGKFDISNNLFTKKS